MGYILTCPQCKFSELDTEFSPSLAGEFWCPKCDCCFEVEDDEEDEDEDEEQP